jgi:phosphoglycerate kinase
MAFKTLDDLASFVKGKRVLVRADLNVPVADGKVTDATRIERQAPTIKELAEAGARVIVLSHFDRPKGKVVPSMSLKVLVEPLSAAPWAARLPLPKTVSAPRRKPLSLP